MGVILNITESVKQCFAQSFRLGVLTGQVANQRSKDQELVTLAVNVNLLREVERLRKTLNEDRSLFIRRAIADKLRALNIHVPPEWVEAPDRARKRLGETTSVTMVMRYPDPVVERDIALNDEARSPASSTEASGEEGPSIDDAVKASRRSPKSSRSTEAGVPSAHKQLPAHGASKVKK